MYSGVLEREYVEQKLQPVMPEYFLDLNLNQIVRELQEKAKDYDIRRMFFQMPKDYETVLYRQAIYREIRQKQLEIPMETFSKKMRETREYKERHEKVEDKQQYQMYWFNAVSAYVDGVELLRSALLERKAESEGLAGLLTYLEELCGTALWKECLKEKEKINGMLSTLRFEVSIDGTNLRVRTVQQGKFYFDRLKKLFPHKFSDKMSEHVGEEDIPRDYMIRSPFVTKEELSFWKRRL